MAILVRCLQICLLIQFDLVLEILLCTKSTWCWKNFFSAMTLLVLILCAGVIGSDHVEKVYVLQLRAFR